MLRIISKSKLLIGCLVLLIFFISCDKKRIYDKYLTLDNQEWNIKDELQFVFSIQDTLKKRNIFINLRNNKEFYFRNLFLITQLKFPDGNIIIDTLEYDMADATGKFLGNGFSDIKENKLFYKENIVFPKKGTYVFKIRQAMRKSGEVKGIEKLKGITDIGLRIEKRE